MIRKITPLLLVDEIEPALTFWIEQLGFEMTTELPEGDQLGFAILAKDGLEIMYWTRASVANDLPVLSPTPENGTVLYIEVEDLDSIIESLEGAEIVVPRRQTFYGADEIYVREPGGHIVGFAASI